MACPIRMSHGKKGNSQSFMQHGKRLKLTIFDKCAPTTETHKMLGPSLDIKNTQRKCILNRSHSDHRNEHLMQDVGGGIFFGHTPKTDFHG